MNLSFHTMMLLAYTIPNIYVFFRVWQLFISRGYRLHYTVVYLLIAAIYPASDWFGNTHFFVTSGIRQWRFPVRTVGKSEIMVIDINFVR